MQKKYEQLFIHLLAKAGIEINGPNLWDPQVHDDRLYHAIAQGGRIAIGESYMAGWWSVQKLDELIFRALDSGIEKELRSDARTLVFLASTLLLNRQSKTRAYQVGEEHYDTGNDLFERMLDPLMLYSCGYWKDAKDLDEAQLNKAQLIGEKLQLKEGMRVLDIGCGWGGLARYLAQNYGVSVVGVTVSKEQQEYGMSKAKRLPVNLRLEDYRNITDGPYDRIVSVGMFEHVGYKNYQIFMEVTSKLLKEDGLFLLHTIGGNRSVTSTDPWVDKYIFPNGMLPSVAQMGKSFENLFVMEDWHNFGPDYDKTLMAWYENFIKSWPELKKTAKYTDRFFNMWEYYLLSSAGLFRARKGQLWQVVLSKRLKGGYRRPNL